MTGRIKENMESFRKVIIPILLAVVIGIGGWQLKATVSVDKKVALVNQKVDGFDKDFARLRADVSTALTVLGQHGEEFANLDGEQLRLRTLYDELNVKIDSSTTDRFTGSDGSDLRQWVRDEFLAREKLSELQHEKIMMLIEQLQTKGKIER